MTFSTYLSPGVAIQGGGSGGGGAASAPLTGTGAIITTSQPLIDVSQTWSNSSATFTAVKLNVTNTNSAAASLLLDLQVGTTSLFSVGKAGNATAPSGSAAVPSYSISAAGLYSRASVRLNFAFSGADAGVEIGPATLALQNTASLVWTSGALPSSGPDVYLTRVAAGTVKFAGTSGTGPGVVVTNSTVVASLPAAATAGAGAFAFVTDATMTMALGIGTAVVGGGANKVPVYSDGANWFIG